MLRLAMYISQVFEEKEIASNKQKYTKHRMIEICGRKNWLKVTAGTKVIVFNFHELNFAQP